MQDPNKVNFAAVYPETREKVKIFLSTLKLRKCTIEGKKVKTLEDALLFAIEQAEKVPALEQEIKELKEKIRELEKQMVEDREMRG